MVAPKLDQAEIERAKRKPVENLDAYDYFLRGMANMYDLTRNSCEEAIRLFYRAIELDPGFATPYGAAARCYSHLRGQGWSGNRDWEESEVSRLASRVIAHRATISAGEWVTGDWVNDHTHGQQFKARFMRTSKGHDPRPAKLHLGILVLPEVHVRQQQKSDQADTCGWM